MPGETLISIRSDPTSLARVGPVDMPVVADPKLAAADLVAAVKSIATADRLRQIAADRSARVTRRTPPARSGCAKSSSPRSRATTTARSRSSCLAYELESILEPDTIYVADLDTGKQHGPVHVVRPARRKPTSRTARTSSAGACRQPLGAKLARPDSPVVAILGDGAFLFGGPQPLWSQARYNSPVTNIVLNNRSYNNERNRIWTFISAVSSSKWAST